MGLLRTDKNHVELATLEGAELSERELALVKRAKKR